MKITAIVAASIFTNIAIIHSSAQDASAQSQKGSSTPTEESSHYSYKVLLINKQIYLKFLNNDSKELGPFNKYDGQDGRYIYIPKDRPQEFASAMQIFRDRSSSKWFYTDNWVHMSAKRVDPNGILPPKEAQQDGGEQQATRPSK